MAERSTRSLLEFAIAASLAIVPVMLGMLLLVAVIRPADPDAQQRNASDRYRSVRQVAALKTFEEAVVARSSSEPLSLSGGALLAGLPACQREWGVSWRHGDWLPFISRAGAATSTQAERIAASLAEFDAALLRFSARANARVSRPVGLDLSRWFAAAARSMAQPLELPELPGQRFQMGCADLASALSALLRQDARMLDTLAWRGTVGNATLAHWRPDQQVEILAQQLTRRNPWNGVAGCIYLGEASTHYLAAERSAQRRLCGLPQMASAAAVARAASEPQAPSKVALLGEPGLADPPDDTRWMVPPSLQAMLQPLEALRQPNGSLYRQVSDSHGNRVALGGASVDVGYSIDLTIDPATQALAQKTAACYTGRHDVCDALGLQRAEDKGQPIGHQLLEGAMVRMAAVAVIDVASGRIEARAGAMSPCARQEVDGPGRDPGCDTRLPYPVQYRPDALLNPAVFHDAMPASTIKPILAAAFLSDPEVGPRWLAAERAAMERDAAAAQEATRPSLHEPTRESLRGQLMRSDSARFLDRMFCFDKGFDRCRRPWDVQALAPAFGWNAGCADAALDCGKQDLLFGRAIDAAPEGGKLPSLTMPVAYGRLMSEPLAGKPNAPMHLMPLAALRQSIVSRCAVGADGRRMSDDDWTKCRGGAVVDVVAEGWGQGHARASALGIAGMMATLAAAANGQAEVRRPHLVAAVRGAGASPALARWGQAAAQPNRLSPDAAEVILSGLSFSHRVGTARTACEQVFDAQRCRAIDWLAGKTGTPSFPSDGVSLNELAQLCPRDGTPAIVKVSLKAGTKHDTKHDTKPLACSSLRPYKWYVATYRADHSSSGPWTKVIAVLTERNWLQRSGIVHGAGDHGPNPSAEIAMQIVGRQVGLISGQTPGATP
ncbi:MAG TPA: hypothetical protein VGQ91_12655 [Ideonella sp.]|nr:hypothetical protein [Ideonella sp.]